MKNKMKNEEESLRIKKKICNILMEEKNYNKIHTHLAIAEGTLHSIRLTIRNLILNIKSNKEIDAIVMNKYPTLKDAISGIEYELNQVKDELL